MYASQRLFYLSYLANLMNNEPGSKPEEAAKKSAQFTERDVEGPRFDGVPEGQPSGDVGVSGQSGREPRAQAAQAAPAAGALLQEPAAAAPRRRRGRKAAPRRGASDLPFTQSVFDAGIWIDGTDPDLTDDRHQARRSRATCTSCRTRNVAAPGALAPRQFLTVLSKGDTTFKQGSGRLELADDIFTRAAPLAARVIVNRVWGWHFGKPLVATAERFRSAGREAHASGIAGRSGGALHRQRLVAEVAASRNHALGRVPAVEPSARRRPGGRRHQQPAVAHESAPARRRGLSRQSARSHRATLDDDRSPALSFDLDAADNHLPHGVRPREPRPAEYACWRSTIFPIR